MTRNGDKKQLMLLVVFLFACLVYSGCATTPPDPYAGTAYITIHSHPQGARIYANGQYFDTTPLPDNKYSWGLDYQTRSVGLIKWGEVVFVKDGYLPVKKTYRLELDPPGKRKYHFHDLVILERDPNAPSYSYTPSNRKHITIKQEESGLDQLLKAGQIGLILQSLKPIR